MVSEAIIKYHFPGQVAADTASVLFLTTDITGHVLDMIYGKHEFRMNRIEVFQLRTAAKHGYSRRLVRIGILAFRACSLRFANY